MFGLFPNVKQGQKDAMLAMGLNLLGNNGRANNLGSVAASAMANARQEEAAAAQAAQAQSRWEAQQSLEREKFDALQKENLRKAAIEESENQMAREKHRIYMSEGALKEEEAEQKARMVQRLAGSGTAIFTGNNNIDPNAPQSTATSPDKMQARMGDAPAPIPSAAGQLQGTLTPADRNTIQQEFQGQSQADYPEPNASAKSDRFLPAGDEGNPLAIRMAELPQSVKGAMRESPLAASSMIVEPMKAALEESLKAPKEQKAPEASYMNIINKKTGEVLTFDSNSPMGQGEIQRRMQGGEWIKETPGVAKLLEPKTSLAEEHWQEVTKKSYTELQGIREQTEAFTLIANDLMDPKLYTGPAGKTINEVIRYGQQVGLWKDIPIDKYEAANWTSSAIFGKLRESILGPDSRLSDADREAINRAIMNAEFTPKGMARIMSALEGRESLLQAKLDWIEDKTGEGMSYTQAWREWDMKAKDKDSDVSKLLSNTMGEEAMNKRMKSWMDKKGGKGPSILDLGVQAGGDTPTHKKVPSNLSEMSDEDIERRIQELQQ